MREAYNIESELEMPHNAFSTDDLDRLYPRVEVPEELDIDDPDDPEEDPMYKSGMNTVADLMYNLSVQGRHRRFSDIGGNPNKPGWHVIVRILVAHV